VHQFVAPRSASASGLPVQQLGNESAQPFRLIRRKLLAEKLGDMCRGTLTFQQIEKGNDARIEFTFKAPDGEGDSDCLVEKELSTSSMSSSCSMPLGVIAMSPFFVCSDCHQKRVLWVSGSPRVGGRGAETPGWCNSATQRESVMQKNKLDDNPVEQVTTSETDATDYGSEDRGIGVVATVATVVVVGIAALEAALLPGIVLGVAAVCVPAISSENGRGVEPTFQVYGSRSL
jgi:hypothetical protein